MFAGQITVIIFFHLVAAMVTNRLHRPYKVINSQFVRYKNHSLVNHVRIANNIQTFLVKKRYGINYKMLGKIFGLVSITAFLKVSRPLVPFLSNLFVSSSSFPTVR